MTRDVDSLIPSAKRFFVNHLLRRTLSVVNAPHSCRARSLVNEERVATRARTTHITEARRPATIPPREYPSRERDQGFRSHLHSVEAQWQRRDDASVCDRESRPL
jgi:hypothetical protein